TKIVTKGNCCLGIFISVYVLGLTDQLEDKVSFRGLAIFLNEKYHIQVNHSYINKIWNKIEGDL
ncbi:hypothetical protein, partial [Aliarcobacter butzleri]|uniref:hypothetical protein n=1 Tax=Aliarcobacter butzleri TaxID=28197 RepID=UPI003AF75D7D